MGWVDFFGTGTAADTTGRDEAFDGALFGPGEVADPCVCNAFSGGGFETGREDTSEEATGLGGKAIARAGGSFVGTGFTTGTGACRTSAFNGSARDTGLDWFGPLGESAVFEGTGTACWRTLSCRNSSSFLLSL